MDHFLVAQAADPFDPTPMLILADWLEEHGDLAGAEVLRGLVAARIPSLSALAIIAEVSTIICEGDRFDHDFEFGTDSGAGSGMGDVDGLMDCLGLTVCDGDGPGDGFGLGGGGTEGYGVGGSEAARGDHGNGAGDGLGDESYGRGRVLRVVGCGEQDGYHFY